MSTAESILMQLDRDRDVKTVSAEYDLPSGLKVRVDDYRTKSHFDDPYYAKTKSLLLRRGVAAVYCPGDKKLTPKFLLAGLPKFGNPDDEFTPRPVGSLKRRIYTVKENGEAGHLAFFQHNKTWFAVVGSKNVHIVFSVNSEAEAQADLVYYTTLKLIRITGALANARLLIRFYPKTLFSNQEIREELSKNHWTLVFEAIFDNHIVKYDEEAAIAFALSRPQFDSFEKQGLAISPEKSLDKFRSWGFRVPEFDVVESSSDFGQFDRKYETMPNIEGAVIYEVYGGPESGDETVGRIYKHKNHVYVIRRMARELIKRKAVYMAWTNRFQRSHLEITDSLKREADLLLAFYVWTWRTRKAGMANAQSWPEQVQQNFKTWFEQFLKKNAGDEDEIKDLIRKAPTTLFAESADGDDGHFAVVLVGLQGSGKTLLRNSLVAVLGEDQAIYVNQDELGGDRKAFLRDLRDLQKSRGKVMIVDKCNHTYRLREDVYSTYAKVLVCEFIHPNPEQLATLCEQRIKKRGVCHLTLPFSAHAKTVVEKASEVYEPVSDDEKMTNDYLQLNITDRPEVNLKRVLCYLEENKHAKSKNGANFASLDLGELAKLIEKVEQSYEISIKKRALKKVKYWRASADVETMRHLFKPIAPESSSIKYKWDVGQDDENNNYKTAEEYHVTLFYDRKLSEKDADKLLENVQLRVKATSIAFDEKCAAVRVTDDAGRLVENCEKSKPHITLGCAQGVSPSYANDMLERGVFEEIPCDFELDLVINPVLV